MTAKLRKHAQTYAAVASKHSFLGMPDLLYHFTDCGIGMYFHAKIILSAPVSVIFCVISGVNFR